MTLRTIDIPFVRGLNEEPSAKILPLPELTRANNARVTRSGAITQRSGVAQLGSEQSGPVDPVRLARHRDELLIFDTQRLHAYSEATDSFRVVDDTASVTLQRRTTLAVPPEGDVVAASSAATAGFVVHAWTILTPGPEYAIHVMVTDLGGAVRTRSTVLPITGASSNCVHLRLVPVGDVVFLVFGDGGATNLKLLRITGTESAAWDSGSITGLATADYDYSSAPGTLKWNSFDAVAHAGTLVICYATATTLELVQYSEAGAELQTAELYSGDDDYRVVLVGDVGTELRVHAYWGAGSSAVHEQTRYDTAAVTPTGSVLTEGPSAIYDPAYGVVATELDGLSALVYSYATYSQIRTYNTVSGVDASENLYAQWPACVPWSRNGRVYVAMQVHHDLSANYTAIVSLEPSDAFWDRSRGEIQLLSSRTTATPPRMPGNVAIPYAGAGATSSLSGASYHVPLLSYERAVDPSQLAQTSGAEDIVSADLSFTERRRQLVDVVRGDAYEFSLSDRAAFMTAELAGTLYVAAGGLMQYSGRRLVEVGFFSPPTFAEPTVTQPGGTANMARGTYVYALVWEWYEPGTGARHQSAPTLRSVTVDADSSQVVITIPALQVTRKHWRNEGGDGYNVVCAVYRSEAIVDDVGDPLVVDDTFVPPSLHRLEGGTAQQFVVNDPGALTSGTYTDTRADADVTLASRELLYSTIGGAQELDNFPPPPTNVIIAHQDRIIGIDAERPSRLWYSKSIRNGTGLASSEALSIALEEDATALAKQDGALMVFSRSSTYAVVGQGADNTGGSTNYEPPQRISSESGCVNPRSVISSPAGLFFQSATGIMRMERGGFTAQNDARPQATLTAYPIITAAAHVIETSSVVFVVATSEDRDADARLLVYDYGADVWSVYDYGDGFVIRDVVSDAGRLCWVSPGVSPASHLLAREDESGSDTLHDGAVTRAVELTVETGDMRLAGLSSQGVVSRATLVGECTGHSVITMQTSTDSGRTWEPGATFAVNPALETQCEYTLRTQKAGSFRFRVGVSHGLQVDSAGMSLNGITLEYRTHRHHRRLASAERQG